MDFSVKAKLGYRVEQNTPFVFNLQACAFAGQEILSETLRIAPELPLENWTMPESGNRYFRLIAPPGGVSLSYEATIRLTHPTEDPTQVREVLPGELPLHVLTHLFPSRYCQSDMLERFRQADLRGDASGLSACRGDLQLDPRQC